MKTFIVVDNIAGHRSGWCDLINEVEGAGVVGDLDFPEAIARESWGDVNYVICDLADEPLGDAVVKRFGLEEEQEERHRTTDFTSIELLGKIKQQSPDTVTIAVTGHSFVFDNPVLKRMVRDAHADHFVYRGDLDVIIQELGKTGGDVGATIASLEPVEAPDEIPELGITRDTHVLDMVRELTKEKYSALFNSPKITKQLERMSQTMKAAAEAAGRSVKGVTSKGQPTPKAMRAKQAAEIRSAGSRIPDEFRNRGN